jgi:integrase
MGDLRRIIQCAEIASFALVGRPQEHSPEKLGLADMSAIVDRFKFVRKPGGEPYSPSHRNYLFAAWRTLIQFSRHSGFMDEVPGAFTVHAKFHSMPARPIDDDEDELGKAIPEHVIKQLDDNLELLGTTSSFAVGGWAASDFALMFQTIYIVMRDTGRRPGEVTGLPYDCIDRIDGHPTLIYNNYKRGRHGRRLPIFESTASAIEAWQKHVSTLRRDAGLEEWLFPPPAARARRRIGPLTATQFANAFRPWVDDAIPEILDDHLDADGNPVPFDRSLILCYGFRHSFAQRHADNGTAPDVLRELMDHRSLDTTMGYYQVSLERKQAAIRTIAPLVMDRTGQNCGHANPLAYEMSTVAVPFGGCAEPSNVKAGGGHCPIRFQCAGCSFYRPDPSYLPAIEQEIADLRASKEFAIATGAQTWVIDNIDSQIKDHTEAADKMRAELASMPHDHRIAVEEASKELRKMRSSQAFVPLSAIKVRPTR